MLIVDGVRYKPWTPKDEEKEFHPLVKSQSKEIFGKDSIYFDVKTTLKSASGIGSIPDAYVIDLAEPYQWYVIENELATHPVYDHIVKQLTKFINGIDNQGCRAQILELIYEEINKDDVLRTAVLAKTKSVDLYRFLSKLFSKIPKIVVIIDEKNPDVEEACQALKYAPEIIEFKSYVQEDNPQVYAHLFEPLVTSHQFINENRIEVKESGQGKANIDYHYIWDNQLKWINPPVQEIVRALTLEIQNAFPDVIGQPVQGYYTFNRGKKGTIPKFVGFILHKNEISVRIRADPKTLRDPRKMVNDFVYSGYFFRSGKGQERQFKISEKDQIPYAIELIKQSYELAN